MLEIANAKQLEEYKIILKEHEIILKSLEKREDLLHKRINLCSWSFIVTWTYLIIEIIRDV
jgi:hypothetical protein